MDIIFCSFVKLWSFFDDFILILELPFFARLDVYIHDYLLKRKLHASAKAFMTEGKVATDPVGMLSWVPLLLIN